MSRTPSERERDAGPADLWVAHCEGDTEGKARAASAGVAVPGTKPAMAGPDLAPTPAPPGSHEAVEAAILAALNRPTQSHHSPEAPTGPSVKTAVAPGAPGDDARRTRIAPRVRKVAIDPLTAPLSALQEHDAPAATYGGAPSPDQQASDAPAAPNEPESEPEAKQELPDEADSLPVREPVMGSAVRSVDEPATPVPPG
ncbi:MAG: hypothetical protein L0H93_20065, partial [Nocardioides sp.]|nr:hypothetical protein [Nocardioides sp.]